MRRNFYSKNKYHANKIEINGEKFDSTKEYRRFAYLKDLEEKGEISNLRRQVKYILIPTQREPCVVGKRGGIKEGKVIEKECSYFADFVYKIPGVEKEIVEDTKGFRTTDYIIKRKLMLYLFGIRIKEI